MDAAGDPACGIVYARLPRERFVVSVGTMLYAAALVPAWLLVAGKVTLAEAAAIGGLGAASLVTWRVLKGVSVRKELRRQERDSPRDDTAASARTRLTFDLEVARPLLPVASQGRWSWERFEAARLRASLSRPPPSSTTGCDPPSRASDRPIICWSRR